MKQTAVEWLVLHLNKQEWFTHKQKQFIEQAKEMFEEQVKNAFNDGYLNHSRNSEEYYNENFKSE